MDLQYSTAVLCWYGRWESAFQSGMPKKFRRVLATWLAEQRWFITKQEHAPQIEIEHAWQVAIGEKNVWWLLLHLKNETQAGRYYQLPLVCLKEAAPPLKVIARMLGGQTGWLVDAWSWPPFAKHILQCLSEINGTGELEPGLKLWSESTLEANLAAIPVETDQSNTIIRFDQRYFFKVFRSLTPGVQPDEEVGRYLHHRRFAYTIPPLAGLHWQRETAMTLAMCSPFIANHGSAWSWLVKQLQSEDHDVSQSVAQAIELLGQRTAQLHLTLAQPTDDSAFQPVPLTVHLVNALQQRVVEKAEICLTLLRQSSRKLADVRELVMQVLAGEKELLNRIISWQPEAIDGVLTRIHGDYHLGQVLRTQDDDWLIIDFEGEPLRPTAERRKKDSPLRDVAGMLRSFAYAESVARKEKEGQRPLKQKDSFQSAWHQVIAQFLQRYFATLQGQGVIPSDMMHLQRLLELYELEKVLYEIEYELKSRPDWLWIPLLGLHKILKSGAG